MVRVVHNGHENGKNHTILYYIYLYIGPKDKIFRGTTQGNRHADKSVRD